MRVFLALGSNLGDKEKNILDSLKLLEENCVISKLSSLIKTKPVGFLEQPDFLNGVVGIETVLTTRELLDHCLAIEKKLGRMRTIKNGPRTIDLDILFYGDEIIADEDLIIPHPRLQERRFVLEPLAEIAPEFVHPVMKKKIIDILQELD